MPVKALPFTFIAKKYWQCTNKLFSFVLKSKGATGLQGKRVCPVFQSVGSASLPTRLPPYSCKGQ